MWSKDGRTYYEFRRTYIARKYAATNITGGILWDQELENRVLEVGIFSVSEQDRQDYLNQYTDALGYLHWRLLWETMGRLVQDNQVTLATKAEVEQAALRYVESIVTPVRVLGILGKPENSIAPALDNLETEVHDSFYRIFSDIVGGDKTTVLRQFKSKFAAVILDYNITESLAGQTISVTLDLPGTVIATNGWVDPEKQGGVDWNFKGEDIFDADVSLYALSVVEH